MTRARRLRLRFVPGVSISAATYGTSTFGGPITYGQRASDPVASFRYRIVPLPSGYPTSPAWLYREGDMAPSMQAQIFGDTGPLDCTTVTNATAWCAPVDGRDGPSYLLPMTVKDAAKGILEHVWLSTDNIPPGYYRVVIIVNTQSSRRLSLPTDDLARLTILEVPDG